MREQPPADIADWSFDFMQESAAYGKIDSLSNLAQNAAYIHAGANDKTTLPEWSEAIKLVYEKVGMDLLEFEMCKFCAHNRKDGKNGEIMKWLMTNLGFITEFNDEVEYVEDYGDRWEFSQKEIVTSIGLGFEETQIIEFGRIYVPTSCQTSKCHVHFAFHGKGMND